MPIINAEKGKHSLVFVQILLVLVTVLMTVFAVQANESPDEIVPVNLNASQKLVAQPIAAAGDTLDYTVIINNDTDTTATAIQLNDTLPATLSYVANSITASEGNGIISDSGYPKYLNGAILWQGTLGAKQQIKISFSTQLTTTIANNVPVTNTATIVQAGQTYTKSAVTMITQNSGTELPNSSNVPSLTEARPGNVVRYIITVKNEDPTTTATFAVTDTLPSNVSYVNGSFSAEAVAGDAITEKGEYRNGIISWSGFIVGGKSIKIGFDVMLAADLQPGKVVKNYAIIQDVSKNKMAVKVASTTIVARGSKIAYLPIIINGWPTTPLAAPVLKELNTSTTSYDVTWGAVSNAASYILEESLSADFANYNIIYRGTEPKYTVSNPNRVIYYYRARSVGNDPKYGAYISGYSNVVKSVSTQFYADATSVGTNGCTTLRWNFTNIKTIAIVLTHGMDPQPSVGVSSRNVCPSINTTYKAIVVDKNDVKTEYAFTVNYTGTGCNLDPYVNRFEASSLDVLINTNVTIYWDVMCAKKIYVQAQNGDRNPAVGKGERSWPVLTATRTFWLSVVGTDTAQTQYVSTIIVKSHK